METKVVLVGNPNTGKTTLYNRLTKSDEHVGNWHGVTIDAKSKSFEVDGQTYEVVDLPGIYSLTPYNPEERVTTDYLFHNKCKILNICDINNLKLNFYLTLQLIEAGYDVSIIINITDKKDHSSLINRLSSVFKDKIVFINVQKDKNLHNTITGVLNNKTTIQLDIPYFSKLKDITKIISKNASNIKLSSEFVSIKIIENDTEIIKKLQLDESQVQAIEKCKHNLNVDTIARLRFDFIQSILVEKKQYKVAKVDKLLLNRALGIPVFIGILVLIFYITFGPVGTFLKECLSYFIQDFIGLNLYEFMQANNFNYVITDFVYKGLICGVGGIISFLPQIVLLFFFLSILEESGYLSRLAFLFEDLLNKIGLSGKSLFTLIMSCGCSTIAMMTARNIEDENIKKKTMILSTYMCCSAKLPIFVILTSTFFSGNYLLIFGLYILSIVVSVFVAMLMKRSLPNKNDSFILEFPCYRIPTLQKMWKFIYSNTMLFLTKIGSVLLLFSLIFYFLNTYDFNLIHIDLGGVSIMQRVCEVIAPIFAPLGFGNWGAVSALVSGIVAKEIIVSSIGVINGVGGSEIAQSLVDTSSNIYFDTTSALSFMIFALLYVPCLSSISVMVKQLGGALTTKAIILQFIIAYIVTLIVYLGIKLLDINFIFVVLLFVVLALIVTIGRKKMSPCAYCRKNCEDCCIKRLD